MINQFFKQKIVDNHFNVGRHGSVPVRSAISNWVRTFRTTASIQKTIGRSIKTARTPENLERVRAAVTRIPKRSARKHAVALGTADFQQVSAEDFVPRSLFPSVQNSSDSKTVQCDYTKRVNLCNVILEFKNQEQNFHEHLFMSDEAHFHLSRRVNKQNMRYWSDSNP